MNPPNTGSRAPFFIVLILLLVITGVQFFFNFRGLSSDAAMDQAQIARNVARGEGLITHRIRPIQLIADSASPDSTPSFPTPSSGSRKPFWQVRGKAWWTQKNSLPTSSVTRAMLR